MKTLRGILIFSYPTPRAMLPPPPTPGAHGACEDGWMSRRVEGDSKDSNIFKRFAKRCESSQLEIQLIESTSLNWYLDHFNSKTVLLHFGRIPLLNFIAGSTNRLCLVIGNLLFSQHGHLKAAINHRQNPNHFAPCQTGCLSRKLPRVPRWRRWAMEALASRSWKLNGYMLSLKPL